MIKYKLFPKVEDVFTEVTVNHKAVFFPLISIDLASIGKGEGKIHFISYFRNGEPVENTDPNFSYNYMRFNIVKDQYKFEGDFNKIYLFEKSIEWYKEAELIYHNHKADYFSNSDWVKKEDAKRMEIDFEHYYYIKGILNYWVTRDKYLETGKFIQGGAYTYGYDNHERECYKNVDSYDDDKDGYIDEVLMETLNEVGLEFKELQFIGTIAGYNYLGFGADEISIFLQKNRTVFHYYNWS